MFSKEDASFRTLVGTNILFNGIGAIGEIFFNPSENCDFIKLYTENLNSLIREFKFDPQFLYKKSYSQGIIFALKTEIDLIYVGREILELAFNQTFAIFYNDSEFNFSNELEKLHELYKKEFNLLLRNLFHETLKRNINIFYEDNIVTLGSGTGLYSFNLSKNNVENIPWNKIYNIPAVAVTGSNGKTTTVILTKFIAEQSGKTVGYSSTERIMIADHIQEIGDLSGPYGAREILGNKNVDIAVLELARGSITKRGVGANNLLATVVTNVSADHIGLNGIDDIHDLAKAKFLIHNAIIKNGYHIINLDDQLSHNFILQLEHSHIVFSSKMNMKEISSFLKNEHDLACFIENDILTVLNKKLTNSNQNNFTLTKTPIINIKDIPLTYHGLANHNIDNVLAATCLSIALNCSYANIKKGLLDFDATKLNQGRLNIFSMNGYKNTLMIVDYAHNVASVDSIIKFAKSAVGIKAKITLLIGLTGDRIFMIDDMVQMIIAHNIDFVMLKAFNTKLRGAKTGEVAKLMEDSLIKYGFPNSKLLDTVEVEMDAVDTFLDSLEDDHAYIVLSQEEIEKVVNKIEKFNN